MPCAPWPWVGRRPSATAKRAGSPAWRNGADRGVSSCWVERARCGRSLCANLLGGGYIYGLYAFVCEDALLRPAWNFNGHPLWPEWLIFLRDGALIGFLVFGGIWIVKAMAGEIRAWRNRDR